MSKSALSISRSSTSSSSSSTFSNAKSLTEGALPQQPHMKDVLAGPSTANTIPYEDTDRPRLIFSKNSLRNASIVCDALGIHYQISTPTGMVVHRTTQMTRWDPRLEKNVLVAEWERNPVKSDRYRILRSSVSDEDFRCVTDVFPRTSWLGYPFFDRSFVGYDGKKYIWKSLWSLQCFVVDESTGKEILVASFHRRNVLVKRRHTYIDLYPGYENSLDLILLFSLYCDRRRRDYERRQ